jgi:hypothetical protein
MDRPAAEQSAPKACKSGIEGPAGFNTKAPAPGDLKAPTKHYPSTTAMVPKKANVIDGAGKGKGIK